MNVKVSAYRIVPIATAVVGLGLISFLVAFLIRAWPEIAQSSSISFFPAIPLALAGYLGFWLLMGVTWRSAMGSLGHQIAVGDALRMWCLSMLTRYLPGGFWYGPARAFLARKGGVPVIYSTGGLAIELLLSLTAFLIIAVVSLPFWTGLPGFGGGILTLVLAPALLIISIPGIFNRILSKVSRVLYGDGESPAIGYGSHLRLLGQYLAIALLYSLGTYFVFSTLLLPTDGRQVLFVMGAASLAWALGVLSPGVPGGIGVREGALVGFLSLECPVAVGVAVALLSRFLVVAAELLCLAGVMGQSRVKSWLLARRSFGLAEKV